MLPGISLCMIVKNEEKNIAECLKHAEPLVSQMIVVDTGSSDRTKELARDCGARVFDFPWADDFAAARNFSLAQATCGYALVLDADEHFSPGDVDELKLDMASAMSLGASLNFIERNYTNDATCVGFVANAGEFPQDERGAGWFPTPSTRLFPSSTRYAGVVHENPIVSGKVWRSDRPIHHYGKLDAGRTSSKAWYYELGLNKLRENGDGYAIRRELGIQAAKNGLTVASVDHWTKALEFKRDDLEALINLTSCLITAEEYDKALSAAIKAARVGPKSKAALANLGICQLLAGSHVAADRVLRRCLRLFPGDPSATITLGLVQVAAQGRGGEGVLKALMVTYGLKIETVKDLCRRLEKTGQSRRAESLRKAVQTVES